MFYEIPDSPGYRREVEENRRRALRLASCIVPLAIVGALVITAAGEACTPSVRRDAASVTVDVARCVLEHLDLDPQGITVVCGVDALRDPAVTRLIASHQVALDRARTGACLDVTPRGRP